MNDDKEPPSVILAAKAVRNRHAPRADESKRILALCRDGHYRDVADILMRPVRETRAESQMNIFDECAQALRGRGVENAERIVGVVLGVYLESNEKRSRRLHQANARSLTDGAPVQRIPFEVLVSEMFHGPVREEILEEWLAKHSCSEEPEK